MEEPEHWRWQGPVVRGERTAMPSTNDQQLLESRGASDWVHTDPVASVADHVGIH